MTPRWAGLADGSSLYLPTLAGTSQVLRVRSGLIWVHDWPPSRVFQRVFAAKKSVRGSTGENRTGWVRTVRQSVPPRETLGPTVWTWPVRRSQRVTPRPP